ncbi:MAG: serpin family protein [Oscillospiraceae bacterium]|nr:serpin family protein [Oscillospiraceae bacterium]
MKFKKTTALITSLILAAGSFNGVSSLAYGNEYSCEGMTLSVDYSVYSRLMNDESLSSLREANITSDSELIAVPSEIEGQVIAEINRISSESTKYLVLPENLIKINHNAFENCRKLEAVLIPDKTDEIMKISPDITVVGNENTYAEFYAEKNGNEFVLSGDINNDGKTGASDIVSQIKYLIGQKDFENGISRLAADLNGDGNINIIDLMRLKNKILEDNTVSIQSLAEPYLPGIVRSAPEPEVQSGFLNFAAEYSDDILSAEDQNGGSNRIYSPLSIYMAFSVLAECCDGQSLDELLGFLDVNDKEELRKINHDMFTSLYFDEFKRYCRMTNSIWVDRRYTCEEGVLKNLADYYYTASFSRDLSSGTDCSEISEWIYQNTSGKFRPQILPSPDNVLKIINTVTFKENWDKIFDTTAEGTFYNGNDEINCTFMKGFSEGRITETETFVKYSKDFLDGYVMNFVLPAENTDVNSLLSNPETMDSIFSSSGEIHMVTASVPKFSSSSKFDLIPVAETLGVEKIFHNADITPLLNPDKNGLSDTYVNGITHEAVIDVAETGCEAAAYTMICMTEEAPAPDYPVYTFNANRPFMYYISDTNGTPLFIGTVNNPTEK